MGALTHSALAALGAGSPTEVTASDWIALAGVVSTAVVGIYALRRAGATSRDERASREREAKENRDHAERMDKGSRYFSARLEAYREVGRLLERDRHYVARTVPVLTVGDGEQPLEPLSPDEWAAVMGRIAVASSDEVLAKIAEADRLVRMFAGAAMAFQAMRDQRAPADQTQEAFQAMDAARKRAFEAIDAALSLMRQELRDL